MLGIVGRNRAGEPDTEAGGAENAEETGGEKNVEVWCGDGGGGDRVWGGDGGGGIALSIESKSWTSPSNSLTCAVNNLG